MKVLLIEDSAEIQEAVSLSFELHWPDAQVISAGEGYQGVALAETESPDIIILDLGLPDIDGLEVLRRIRKSSDVPVVILTVRGEDVDKVRGLELGADDYMVKPFSHKELLSHVKSVMRRSHIAEPRQAEKPIVAPSVPVDSATRTAPPSLPVDSTARTAPRGDKPVKPKVEARDNIWRIITIGVASALVLACIVFALPIIRVPIQSVETYTETEYKEEAYTEREPYAVQATEQSVERKTETLYDSGTIGLSSKTTGGTWGAEVHFGIDLAGKLNPVVAGSWEIKDLTNAAYVTITGPDLNLVYKYRGSEGSPQGDNFKFEPKVSGTYDVYFSLNYPRIGKYAKLKLTLEWDGVVDKAVERTEYREVTKYRQLPVEAEKQRTVVKYESSSVWEMLFK